MANTLNQPTVAQPKAVVQKLSQLTFPGIATVTAGTITASVPGALPEMSFHLNAPFLDNGLVATAYCVTAGTIVIKVTNVTGGTVTGSTQDMYVISL